MNIWYVHPYAGGPGLGRFYRPWHLAKAWGKLGARTTVFVADYHHILDKNQVLPPETRIDGVRYVALSAGAYKGNGLARLRNMLMFTWSLWRSGKRVRDDLPKPDAIIISSPHPFAFLAGYLLARRFKAKLVFEVRDLWPLSITVINGTSTWHPIVWVTGWIERFAYSSSDLVASLLPGVDNYMRERRMTYRSYVWVPNGFEVQNRLAPAVSSEGGKRILDVVNRWNASGRLVIAHPGGMGPPNGLNLLLDAVAVLKDRGLDHKIGVLLVGDGILRKKLEAQVRDLSLQSVIIDGPLPKAEVLEILSLCHLGYCGGKRHDAVYCYGISFNKLMDFLSLGIDILLPIPGMVVPNGFALDSVLVVDDKPEAIADAIVAKLSSRQWTGGGVGKISKDVFEFFEYGGVAKRYLHALFPSVRENAPSSKICE